MTIVVDTYGRHSAAEIRAQGAIGTVRYLAPAGSSKAIDKAEYDELLADGIQVALNWEHSADDYTGGYSLGHSYGVMARAQARALGHPDSRPIYVSVDTSIDSHALTVALSYVRGFRDGCGPAAFYGTALYGTAYLIDACHAAKYIEFGWQSCSRGFFDNQRTSPHAALLQRCDDATFDHNTVLLPDWGQVPSASVVPVPGVPSAPDVVHQLQGDTVKLTEVRIETDGNGSGWKPTVAYDTFVSATAQGSYPPADGYWHVPSIGVQNRSGKALVTVQGGPRNSSVIVLVASTS